MSHVTPVRPSVFARLQSKLSNVLSKKKPSVFERLETNQKALFHANVLSFLSPQDVASYLQSHKGSTPTPTMRNKVQRTIIQYRPMSTLKEIREAAVFNGGELIPQSAFKYSLTHLDCSNSDITEEELEKIVRAYPRLINLNLSGCRNIRNISMLKRLTHLQSLSLNNNGFQDRLQDITSLKYLTQLRWLDLRGNLIGDITFLQNLTSLQSLFLSRTLIQDISPLLHLTQLKTLDLSNNPIQDITPLQGLTQLKTLDLNFNQIQDISPLQHLTQLKTLDLSRNQIIDITPLQGLTQLQALWLRVNRIQDITPLQHLTQLRELDLALNLNLQDITPLQHLTQLQKLNLIGTAIEEISLLRHLIDRPGFEYNEVKSTRSTRCVNRFLRCLEATFDRVETKIAWIAMFIFFAGGPGGFLAACQMGAYSFCRRNGMRLS